MAVWKGNAGDDGWGAAGPPRPGEAFARPWRHLGPPILGATGAQAPLLARRLARGVELLWSDPRLRRAAFGAEIAALLAIVLGLLLASLVATRLPVAGPEPPPVGDAPSRPVADEEARLAASMAEIARRLAPGDGARPILEVPEGLRRVEVFTGPFVAADGVTLRTVQGTAIRLAEVDGFSRDQVCVDAAGLRFACGLQARAALTNLVRERRLTCAVVRDLDSETIEAVCRIDAGPTLSERLVVAGWAVPRADRRAAYAGLIEARCAAGNDRTPEVALCDGRRPRAGLTE